jgi:hypothetical protein
MHLAATSEPWPPAGLCPLPRTERPLKHHGHLLQPYSSSCAITSGWPACCGAAGAAALASAAAWHPAGAVPPRRTGDRPPRGPAAGGLASAHLGHRNHPVAYAGRPTWGKALSQNYLHLLHACQKHVYSGYMCTVRDCERPGPAGRALCGPWRRRAPQDTCSTAEKRPRGQEVMVRWVWKADGGARGQTSASRALGCAGFLAPQRRAAGAAPAGLRRGARRAGAGVRARLTCGRPATYPTPQTSRPPPGSTC